MTKKAIRTVPSELPHARIYLDDLFEIEAILLDEFSKLTNPPSVSFEYEIDGNVMMTTHDELLDHGGHTTDFSLNICTTRSGFGGRAILTILETGDRVSIFRMLLKIKSGPFSEGLSKSLTHAKIGSRPLSRPCRFHLRFGFGRSVASWGH